MSEPEKLIAYVTGIFVRYESPYGNRGVVLTVDGKTLEEERRAYNHDLEDWSTLPMCHETGLMVFEAVCLNRDALDRDLACEPWWDGSWRRPTPHELIELKRPIKH